MMPQKAEQTDQMYGHGPFDPLVIGEVNESECDDAERQNPLWNCYDRLFGRRRNQMPVVQKYWVSSLCLSHPELKGSMTSNPSIKYRPHHVEKDSVDGRYICLYLYMYSV